MLRLDPLSGCFGWKLLLSLWDFGTGPADVDFAGNCLTGTLAADVGELGDDGVDLPDDGSRVTGGRCRTTSSRLGLVILGTATFGLEAGRGGLSRSRRSLALLRLLPLYDSALDPVTGWRMIPPFSESSRSGAFRWNRSLLYRTSSSESFRAGAVVTFPLA